MKNKFFYIIFVLSIVIISTKFLKRKSINKNNTFKTTLKKETIHTLNTESDIEKLFNNTKPFIIKFHAPWCGACTYMNTTFSKLANDFFEKIDFYSLNTDNNKLMDLILDKNIIKEPIQYLPTFVLVEKEKIYKQITGVQDYEAFKNEIIKTFNI